MNTNIRNLKTEGHQELRAANREWSDCVAKNFLPHFKNAIVNVICSACLNNVQMMCNMYLFELINVFVALGIDESIDYPSCNGIATRPSFVTDSCPLPWKDLKPGWCRSFDRGCSFDKNSSEETFLQRSAPPQSANRQVESFLGNYSMILVSNIGE